MIVSLIPDIYFSGFVCETGLIHFPLSGLPACRPNRRVHPLPLEATGSGCTRLYSPVQFA